MPLATPTTVLTYYCSESDLAGVRPPITVWDTAVGAEQSTNEVTIGDKPSVEERLSVPCVWPVCLVVARSLFLPS